MSDDPRVQQLLDELLDSDSSPEAVCRSCPELLPIVRERWREMCRLRANLDELFPLSDEANLEPSGAITLPRIPGHDVEGVLGRGGMGVVYKARHLRLNRLVAVKVMPGGGYAGLPAKARFLGEAEALAGIRHPNVVRVYDFGDLEGQPFLTMEYVEGGHLAQKLAGVPQPAPQAAQLVAVLAGAVQAAHQAGIVHRDLKPGNVLLTEDGTPKISDFGVARCFDVTAGITRTGTPIGTPSYMAPELSTGDAQAVGPAVDIYALGAMLYELLTGRPPFRAETASETLLQVISHEPVAPSRLNATVPRDLQTICMKCLEKDPKKRYSTAGALADDLGRFLKLEPIHARPAGLLERALRWLRRRRPLGNVESRRNAAGLRCWERNDQDLGPRGRS
jgi:eukaryotic-like serine/threonine-protein kinase